MTAAPDRPRDPPALHPVPARSAHHLHPRPAQALTVCAEPGCPQPAVRRGRCPDHLKQRPRGSTRAWRKTVAQVLRRDHGICQLCHQPGATSADHIIRASQGGTDDPSNLRAAHTTCNSRRG